MSRFFLDGTNQPMPEDHCCHPSIKTVIPRGTLDFKALYVTLCVCVSNSILVPNTNSLRPRTTSIDLVVVMELDITIYLQQQCLWMSQFDLSHCGCHIADIVSHCDVSHCDVSHCDVSHCGCHIVTCHIVMSHAQTVRTNVPIYG